MVERCDTGDDQLVGGDSFHFFKYFDQVTGYDFSPKMINLANRNRTKIGATNLQFVLRDIDAEHLTGIPDESADFINSGFGMGSFIEDLDGLIEDVGRVLRPGGVFTVSFYNSDALVNQIEDLDWVPSLSARIGTQKGVLHVNFNGNEYDIAAKPYSMQEAKDILNRHLVVEEISSFPTISSLLPNKIFNNPEVRKLAKLIDYSIRLNEDISGGPYVTAICRKVYNKSDQKIIMKKHFSEISSSREEELVNVLTQSNIEFSVHEHERVITLQDVQSQLTFDKNRLVKTLVFKANGTWVLVALRGVDALDYKKLSTALCIKRDTLAKPLEEEIRQELGFEIGGICPIHLDRNIKLIFDSRVLEVKNMYCGIGANNKTLEVNTEQLINVFKPQVASVSKSD